MPAKPGNGDRRLDHGAQSAFQSAAYSEPWWKGVGTNPLGQAARKASSIQQLNGSLPEGAVESHAHGGLGNGDGRNVPDSQHLKHVPLSAAHTLREHLEPNSQMELVGHSIVLTSYPHSDPQYGGMLASYGPQTMVSPHLYGMHHARMALPLQMEDEPVYVNAKQYHGILRRRQIRARAELEKKATKARKPYLHESRHLHAVRRARGCGGRFLNTKKLDNDMTCPTSEKGKLSTKLAHLSVFERVSADGTAQLNSVYDQQEGNGLLIVGFPKAQPLANGNTNGHGLSSTLSSSNEAAEVNYFGQHKDAVPQGNRAQDEAPNSFK